MKWVNRNIANDYSVWQEEELLGYLREKFFIFIFIFEIRKRNVGVATVARWIISQRDAATSVKLCRWDEFRFGSFFFPPVFLLFFFFFTGDKFASCVCIPTHNAANTSYVESPSLEGFRREWNTHRKRRRSWRREMRKKNMTFGFRFLFFIIFSFLVRRIFI